MPYFDDGLEEQKAQEGSPELLVGQSTIPDDIAAPQEDVERVLAEQPAYRTPTQMPLAPAGPSQIGEVSDATLKQRAALPNSSGGGFDIARALVAFGGGNISAFDAERRSRAEAPMRALQQKQEYDLGQAKLNQFSALSQQAKDMVDPGSQLSLQEQKGFAEEMAARANQIRQSPMPGLAPEFEAWAKRAPSMSAAQIANARKSPRMSEVLRMLDSQSRLNLAEAGLGIKQQQATTQASAAQSQAADRYADNARAEAEFLYRQQKDAADREARLKAGRIRAQFKNVDKKAVEELQNIGAMESQLKDAEEAIPKAMTGPGTDTALAVEGAANSSIGKALGADKLFKAVTPEGTTEALAASRTVRSGVEQAIAEMKLKRHGASFTKNEQAVVEKWAPGVKLGPEDNALLLSALRKYMAARGQQRLQQVYKETGLPIYLPPNAKLSLEDTNRLKAEYEGIDKYDDATASEIVDRVNDILKPYGGRVSGGSTGSKQSPGAEIPEGTRAKNNKDGKMYIRKGGKWVAE